MSPRLAFSPFFILRSRWPMLSDFSLQFMSSESYPPTGPKVFFEPDNDVHLNMVPLD